MNEKLDLLVFGDTAIDHFYEVDSIPKINNAAEILRSQSFYGGMGANTAVVATNLGLKVGLFSVIGTDAEDYVNYMRNLGVKLFFKGVFGDTTRSLFFKANDKSISFFYRGVTSCLNDLEVDEELIENSKCIYMARTYLKLQKKVSKFCRNKLLVYNPGYGVFKFDKIPDDFYTILKRVDILIMNKHELDHLEKLGFKLNSNLGPEVFIITIGSKGCDVYSKQTQIRIPAYQTKVVDTSGAGDAFNAGFITAYLKGFELYDAVKIGNVTASFIVEKWGCQTNLPTWDAIIERYKRM
ncbi:MAG: PfkB family carbohydrate kinase [Candidatus Altiarchaeota archaeon]